ncbi:MAG: hypothetical protein EBU84_17945 [Actinobacteria bacterium]|nr:hypothetical protein [Actinomycetota bacterium]
MNSQTVDEPVGIANDSAIEYSVGCQYIRSATGAPTPDIAASSPSLASLRLVDAKTSCRTSRSSRSPSITATPMAMATTAATATPAKPRRL